MVVHRKKTSAFRELENAASVAETLGCNGDFRWCTILYILPGPDPCPIEPTITAAPFAAEFRRRELSCGGQVERSIEPSFFAAGSARTCSWIRWRSRGASRIDLSALMNVATSSYTTRGAELTKRERKTRVTNSAYDIRSFTDPSRVSCSVAAGIDTQTHSDRIRRA